MLLRIGDQGADVGRAQQALVESGLGIDGAELQSSTFGHSTYDAVRQFQAQHVDSGGHALTEDGIIGPDTLWALMSGAQSQRGNRYTSPGWHCFPGEARGDLAAMLTWAMGCIGLVEDPPGSNRATMIDGWAREAGMEPGAPWCTLFVSACFQHLPFGSPFGWLASAYKIQQWGLQHDRLVTDLQPGDIWVIMRANFHGHAGLVGCVEGGKVHTIEGNSGDACRGLIRDPASFAAVVRPVAA